MNLHDPIQENSGGFVGDALGVSVHCEVVVGTEIPLARPARV